MDETAEEEKVRGEITTNDRRVVTSTDGVAVVQSTWVEIVTTQRNVRALPIFSQTHVISTRVMVVACHWTSIDAGYHISATKNKISNLNLSSQI